MLPFFSVEDVRATAGNDSLCYSVVHLGTLTERVPLTDQHIVE